MRTQIPCAACQTPIPVETNSLIAGYAFTCPGCGAEISLSHDSAPRVAEAFTRFQRLVDESRQARRTG